MKEEEETTSGMHMVWRKEHGNNDSKRDLSSSFVYIICVWRIGEILSWVRTEAHYRPKLKFCAVRMWDKALIECCAQKTTHKHRNMKRKTRKEELLLHVKMR